MALIDEAIDTAGLVFTCILKRIAGIQRIIAHLKLLAITGCMQLTGNTPIEIRQLQLIDQRSHTVIGRSGAFERKISIDPIKVSALKMASVLRQPGQRR